LCGNCDGDGSNDFKFPNCEQAISSSSSKLSYTETIQWGSSWASNDETFADLDQLQNSTVGRDVYDYCLNNPIRQYCEDLVPPEVPPEDDDDETPPVEPLPPTDFFACAEQTVLRVQDKPLPPTQEPPTETPTPCDLDRLDTIVKRCQDCALLNRYDPESCVTDLCESGEDVESYECPGETKCVPAKEPTQIKSSGGYKWAVLDNSAAQGVPEEGVVCEEVYYLPPPGWQVAPLSDDGQTIISQNPWSTYCVALGDTSLRTAADPDQEGNCPTKGTIVKTSDGCYIAKHCNTKILIRKPEVPVCGNGILEKEEACDDGNNKDGDGCSSDCQPEVTHFCITAVTPSSCSSVSNVEEEEEVHICLLEGENCRGCVKTDENKEMKYCCDCNFVCC
jgi:cysteine-rich repeat protein